MIYSSDEFISDNGSLIFFALAETAKNAYINALQNDLPEPVTKD